MKTLRLILGSALTAILLAACSTNWWSNNPRGSYSQKTADDELYGDSARNLIWLDQGWSRNDSNFFYTTTQGSQLLPYPFFLALEQEHSSDLFRDRLNMLKYRYIPARPSPRNPDGLPVGFIADNGSSLPPALVRDHRSLGLTCAACHTTEINYNGTAIRVDGGPAMADFESFLTDLAASLKATAKDDSKFNRFANRVLGNGADATRKAGLRAELRRIADQRANYDHLNNPSLRYGFARLDAFGRIFNNALTLVDKGNGVKADAPVSYPCLWDAPREDYVQWTSIASNQGIGPITRNVGEVVGVFAAINPGNPPPDLGYTTSVRLGNLVALENRLMKLESPIWPQNILGRLDPKLEKRGYEVFCEQHCNACHMDIHRDDPNRKVMTKAVPISDLKTDPLTAENIMNGRGKTGFLEGTWEFLIAGNRLPDQAPALGIVGNTVLRTLVGQVGFRRVGNSEQLVQLVGDKINRTINAKGIMTLPGDGPKLQYKARPLNGIWATAPYLHNGSVPNLNELLLPPNERSKTFAVGRREFDPQNVGFQTSVFPGAFIFDTSKPGNSNSGHLYGTMLNETDRRALLEYLKSI